MSKRTLINTDDFESKLLRLAGQFARGHNPALAAQGVTQAFLRLAILHFMAIQKGAGLSKSEAQRIFRQAVLDEWQVVEERGEVILHPQKTSNLH